MGLYSTSLQTLSEMAILENSIDIPKETPNTIVEELLENLNELPYLTEKQAIFDISLIPIKEDSETNQLFLEMEDLYRYMASNKITSITEAIGNILEYNNLNGQFHRLSIVIDEQSILDEIADLGYNISSDTWNKTPPKGLGMPLAVDAHTNFDNIRKIANTKQLMDTLTGRYGLPLIKRKYTKVGLLDSAEITNEDAMPKVNANSKILHEKPKSNNGVKIDEDKEASREEQPGDVDNNLNENVELDPRAARIQELKDIAAGKYDDEDAINEVGILDPYRHINSTGEHMKRFAGGVAGELVGDRIAKKLGGGKVARFLGRAAGAVGGNLLVAHRHNIMNKFNSMRNNNNHN